ncbi:hypothetical protein JCM8208_002094 [Rhodotorula glutinis]
MSSHLDPFCDDSADDRLLAPRPTASAPSSRWSFLDAPSPDLSLVLSEPDSHQEHTDAQSLHSLDHLDGTASDDGRSMSATSVDHDEGAAVVHAARLTRVHSVGLLVPSPSDLHASTSTAPDSLVDPDMSHLAHASAAARPASSTSPGSRCTSSSGVAWPSSDGPASRADLAGLGLPTPPSSSSSRDPFERAFSHSAAAASAREHLSVLGRASSRRHEDDTSSSFGSGRPSSMAYLDTTMPFEATAHSRPSSMLSSPSLVSQRDVARPRPASRSSRTSFPAPPGRPVSQHIVVEFPAVPPRSYSPDVPRPRSADEHAARAPRPPPPAPSPQRSTLALRRSAQHLPPLLPSSSASSPSRHLSIPSPAGLSPSSSPGSPSSPSQIPYITRSDDGFYRLPVTPSSATHSVGRTRRERQSTSDMAFPLPPVPDSATHLLGAVDSPRWPTSTSQYHRSSPSARTGDGPTPSPTTHSLPSSPPPTSPPPTLPDFVSLFLDPPPHGTSDDSSSSSSSSLDDERAQTRYPPAPSPAAAPHRHSHARAQDSLSSAVAGPPQRYSLRQRAVGAPVEGEQGGVEGAGAGGAGARDRLDAWLRGVTPARPPSGSAHEKERELSSSGAGGGSGKVRWAERAAPGWSLRSDPARWGGERAQDGRSSRARSAWRSRRVRIAAAVAGVVVLLLVVGLTVGLSRRAPVIAAPAACNCEHGGSVRTISGDGGCYCACTAGWGGTSCHLNATCAGGGGGGPVAQGLLDVAEQASARWEPKIDTAGLGALLEAYFVPPSASSTSSSSCQAQLALLTLPNLPSSTFPSRLAFTESALVHTLALAESNSSLSQLRTFASALSFAPFGDAPATKPNSNYQVIAGGWTWDFSVLQRSATGDWASVVKPSSDSLVRLAAAPAALRALDRLAPVAAAASAQRTKALEHYWATTLGREVDELQAFREAVQRAEIVVPLDATASVGGGSSMMDVAQAQAGAGSFPPAIGCWSGLSESVVERVNAVEVDVFGLSAVSGSQSLDSDRPLYGVLNLLHLRLPFPSSDKRSSLPQQSLVLKSGAVADRLTVHAGELLVAGPLAAAPTSPSLPATPERFGLLSRLDHVLLDFLLALHVATANDLVDYVVSSPSSPPSPSTHPSLLDNSLPLLEIQLWGGLQYADIDFSRSSLAASSSSSSSSSTGLFFGSGAGDTWRSWALSNTQHASLSRVEWVDAAESEEVVVDQGRGGSAFEGVWAQAASGSLKTSTAVWTALRRAGLVGG